jgi:hypothetical protein
MYSHTGQIETQLIANILKKKIHTSLSGSVCASADESWKGRDADVGVDLFVFLTVGAVYSVGTRRESVAL